MYETSDAIQCSTNRLMEDEEEGTGQIDTTALLIIESEWIPTIDRIVSDIHVDVRLASIKPYRVLANPPAARRIVVPRTKPDEPRVGVVMSTREAHRD